MNVPPTSLLHLFEDDYSYYCSFFQDAIPSLPAPSPPSEIEMLNRKRKRVEEPAEADPNPLDGRKGSSSCRESGDSDSDTINSHAATSSGGGGGGPSPHHQRRLWVKERSRDWWDRCNHPDFPEAEFRRAFRMGRATFEFLCEELGAAVAKEDTTLRAAIPVRQRIAVCVSRLATGDPLRVVSKRFGLGISTCHKLVLEVCSAIKTVLMPKFLQWPDPAAAAAAARRFEALAGIPNVVGSMYTTHIPIIAPKVNVAAYFNHRHTERNQKTSYSITVQGVVDPDGVFTDVCIGWPGSLPDDQVLEKSALYQRGSGGLLQNQWIVGGAGYPLMDWVLVPYAQKNLTWTQHAFNEKVGEVQRVAKEAFARLKGRWGCLQKRTEVKLPDLPVVLGACCVLHNICEMRKEKLEPQLSYELVDDEMLPENGLRSVSAMQARDNIAHNLLHHGLAGTAFLYISFVIESKRHILCLKQGAALYRIFKVVEVYSDYVELLLHKGGDIALTLRQRRRMAGVAGDAAATVAIAVCGGGKSRRAVRWAAANLVPHAHSVLLLHVISPVSYIPSPSGKRVPIERMEREVVEMYISDLKLKSQEVFVPFKRLCGTKNVETLVLDGENPAAALLRYVSDSGTKNLVLGSSAISWIRRIIKDPNVPTIILKSAPNSCNIFVVSRRKLTMKLAYQSVNDGLSTSMLIQTTSHKSFDRMRMNNTFDKQSILSSESNGISHISAQIDVGSHSQARSNSSSSTNARQNSEKAPLLPCTGGQGNLDNNTQTWRKYDVMASFKGIPFVISHSTKESEAPAEVVKLRKELQNTLAMYNRACEDLVHAKKKVHLLSAECSEEAKKVKDALEREETLKQIAAEEKAKHSEVIKEVEEARQLLAKEALDRHKAEIVASNMSSEKSRVVHALLSNDKRCRRYSRNEIEVATDNFCDAKKIGEGSYGDVYKCNLDHTPVAVKVLRQDAGDKKEEFLREVEILSQLRHPHMVLLLGVCPESGCLVYEYMENRSLEDQLFYREGKQPLPWFIRFRIIFEVACGLAFLHGTKPEPIVHRDLKPGNILLDRNYVSKIGDVGLAKLLPDIVPDGLTEYRETILAGTLYYMDPEYQRTGTVRPKSDLYALGIIALQLLTAKHPKGLILNVENAIRGGSFPDVLDKSISDWPLVEAEKLAKLALKCSRLRCRDRPDLELEVLPELEELIYMANVCFKLRQCNVYAPSHYLCPILQEVMDDPYVAADGYTYECRAIKAWLGKHQISPVTKLKLSHTSILPNHSLRSAIQEWRSHAAFLTS
ncbi:U-box domain-containing protein 34-like [Phoenix dactylifera]|uniref:RING-type E3 ubiquitin transferase n=1 Tax=Phoenix dactylifera TaxID=42345 RepID=A0A8B9ALI1_PHODC|nr:U-box domain-containing protein 34-like [Phoenix dactylifera]